MGSGGEDARAGTGGIPTGTVGEAGASGGASSSSGGSPANAGSDAGGASSAGHDGGTGAVAGSRDEPPHELNGCSEYEAQVGPSAGRTILWDGSVPDQPARCMKIRAWQSVVFEGDFVEHPLVALGGDTPSPVTSETSILFAEPGLFGYVCTFHDWMTGAIWVVP